MLKQSLLPFAPVRNCTTKVAISDRYRRANENCARIILQDIDRYGGQNSLMGRWARSVLFGNERRQREWRLVA